MIIHIDKAQLNASRRLQALNSWMYVIAMTGLLALAFSNYFYEYGRAVAHEAQMVGERP